MYRIGFAFSYNVASSFLNFYRDSVDESCFDFVKQKKISE